MTPFLGPKTAFFGKAKDLALLSQRSAASEGLRSTRVRELPEEESRLSCCPRASGVRGDGAGGHWNASGGMLSPPIGIRERGSNGRYGTLLVTHGKTAAARRLLPMTPRVRKAARRALGGNRKRGWVLASSNPRVGTFETLQFEKSNTRKALLKLSKVPWPFVSLQPKTYFPDSPRSFRL